MKLVMRFSGTVGYVSQTEDRPGVFVEHFTERTYFGDVFRASRRLDEPSQVPPVVNGNITLNNSFAIVADEHAYGNINSMRYVMYNGIPWKITNVEVRRPRLILTIGGQWDGNTA